MHLVLWEVDSCCKVAEAREVAGDNWLERNGIGSEEPTGVVQVTAQSCWSCRAGGLGQRGQVEVETD